MENSAHYIKTGDLIQFDSGEKFRVEPETTLQFGDGDTAIFESTGVMHLGPGESLIAEGDFANTARSLVVMLENYRHRRWADLSLFEQGEITGIFSDLVHLHAIDHSKLADQVGREMLRDIFEKSVQAYACIREDNAE